ncbi:MAG: acyl-CoA dehydrogenase [Robiginitomaculum sp.]|nr:MAG: acyl-CoA dehydrogenase [Robiginitomaculum sp.]
MRSPFETEERAAFRESFRKFVAKEITPYAQEWDEDGTFPWHIHEKAGALGLYGFGVDEKYGGLGFDDAFMRLICAEELAQCGVNGIAAALGCRNISIGPIQKFGGDALKARVLPDILSGRKASCLAITEASGGSDVANMKTTATQDGDSYILNGSKTFITGGMNSDYFVVGARTSGAGLKGISLFFVDKDCDGFSRMALERKMGWWCSDQASLFFDNCSIPANNMLGSEGTGFLAIMNNFNYERLSIIGQAIGMMKLALKECIAYAQIRETFGQALIKHQVIRHKIADMSAKIDACEAYANQICWLINDGEMPVAEISKAKFFTTKALEYVASEGMQIFGGAGYLRGNNIERIYREVKVLAIGGGSEEIMKDLAVRQMGL